MAVTPAEMAAVHAKLKAAGIDLSSCGVVYMTSEDEVNKAFAYARLAGISMMVGVPDARCWNSPSASEGDRTSRWRSTTTARPTSASRAGRRLHADQQDGSPDGPVHRRRPHPAPGPRSRGAVREILDRLLDVHIKDVSAASRGHDRRDRRRRDRHRRDDADARAAQGRRTIHFEHEKDAKDPFPGLAESVGYVRGVMASL